jgi:hypothetical protein
MVELRGRLNARPNLQNIIGHYALRSFRKNKKEIAKKKGPLIKIKRTAWAEVERGSRRVANNVSILRATLDSALSREAGAGPELRPIVDALERATRGSHSASGP